MNTQNIESIKDKLRKLIAKEESAREIGNQYEAEAFASKVQEMLVQYELDLNSLKQQGPSDIEVKEERFSVYKLSKYALMALYDPNTYKFVDLTMKSESDWIVALYGAVSMSNYCKVLTTKQDQYVVVLIGTDLNREMVHFMVLQLVSKIRNLARKSFSAYEGIEKRNTFIRGFLKGCIDGIRTKLMLDKLYREKHTPQVNALVVQKDRMLNDFMDRTYAGKLGKGKTRSISSRDGYNKGLETGRTINDPTTFKGGPKAIGAAPKLLN